MEDERLQKVFVHIVEESSVFKPFSVTVFAGKVEHALGLERLREPNENGIQIPTCHVQQRGTRPNAVELSLELYLIKRQHSCACSGELTRGGDHLRGAVNGDDLVTCFQECKRVTT